MAARSGRGTGRPTGRARSALSTLLVVAGLAVAGAGVWHWHAAGAGDPVAALSAVAAPDRADAEGLPAAPPPARPARSRPGAPVEVRVPRLGVAAAVDPVAAPGGTLVPPSDPTRLGWWAAGARPGERGSVLVAGHTVSSGGGALDDLEDVRRGDRVVVGTAAGPTAYVVDDVEVLAKGVLARRAPRLFAQDVPARLVLVTCEDWDGTAYRSNVVVTASPAP